MKHLLLLVSALRGPRGRMFFACLGLTVILSSCRSRPQAEVQLTSMDRYHQPPADTLDPATYDGWKQFRLWCDRCHGEEARGTSFGPDLLAALEPGGSVPTREAFFALLVAGRPERGMPPAARLGLSPEYFEGMYDYLQGRSSGRFVGGRPARRER